MATVPYQTLARLRKNALIERWFFSEIALAMIATSTVAFLPSIAHPARRHAPLSGPAGAHVDAGGLDVCVGTAAGRAYRAKRSMAPFGALDVSITGGQTRHQPRCLL